MLGVNYSTRGMFVREIYAGANRFFCCKHLSTTFGNIDFGMHVKKCKIKLVNKYLLSRVFIDKIFPLQKLYVIYGNDTFPQKIESRIVKVLR